MRPHNYKLTYFSTEKNTHTAHEYNEQKKKNSNIHYVIHYKSQLNFGKHCLC